MVLSAEIIIILVLITALISIIKEDVRLKKSKVPRGTVKEYWNGKERRQSTRINASLVVRYSFVKKHPTKLSAQMKNLSNGGMCLLINEKLKEGTLLSFEFDIPHIKDAVVAEGKVVWADGKLTDMDEMGKRLFQTGIQFVNIRDTDKNNLFNYITKIAE